jgi:hypothetical protein
MCSKCKDFDEKIAHYRRIGVYIPDELTSNGIKQLIEQAMAGKSALHPKEVRPRALFRHLQVRDLKE